MVKYLIISGLLIYGNVYSQDLLSNWQGHWSGKLKIYTAEGLSTELIMELIIATESDTSWQWTLVYRTDSTEDKRNYVLFHKKRNHFVIDELNSIKLDLNLINNGLYSSFTIDKSTLTIFYELRGRELYFTTIATGNEKSTGGEDEIPVVHTRTTFTVQRAVLEKK